ncbi:MAG: macrocin O-methyltransferase [Tissierellia bacterium]|nr:macrocin O-methyltransferase [Tissierellia bacterium]
MSKKIFGFNIDKQWDYENGFYLSSHITRLSKVLAQYELYKSIMTLPGHIVECGVYKGASLIRFCTFREILESSYSRKIIGFDAFGKFPGADNDVDREFIDKFENEGGDGISKRELEKVLTHKAINNYELIEGDITSSVPEYISKHPELKIALLHIDVDVYQPSKIILELLYNRLVKGGLVLFDDYGTVTGETRAIDEFFENNQDILIQKLPISHVPSYITKP